MSTSVLSIGPRVPRQPSIAAILKRCPLTRLVSIHAREHLEAVSFLAYAERGQTIWGAGSPAEFTGVVGAGAVIIKRLADGKELEVDRVGAGQAFGACCADRRTYPLTAVAATNCWYLKIPVRELHNSLAGV